MSFQDDCLGKAPIDRPGSKIQTFFRNGPQNGLQNSVVEELKSQSPSSVKIIK